MYCPYYVTQWFFEAFVLSLRISNQCLLCHCDVTAGAMGEKDVEIAEKCAAGAVGGDVHSLEGQECAGEALVVEERGNVLRNQGWRRLNTSEKE
jgi:hypothetical protein